MQGLIERRVARCQQALVNYDTAFELEYCLVDFLIDARHWCERTGHSFLELDRRAFRAWRDEHQVLIGRPL